MPGRFLLPLTVVTLVLACERGPMAEDAATATLVPVVDSVMRTAAPVARTAARLIAGPMARDGKLTLGAPADPMRTLLAPEDARTVTLGPVIGAGQGKGGSPALDLFGGADRPWRVQVGPRMDLGRNSGLMLRGGTEGEHHRWDLGASATVGERSNVQGVVRFHP